MGKVQSQLPMTWPSLRLDTVLPISPPEGHVLGTWTQADGKSYVQLMIRDGFPQWSDGGCPMRRTSGFCATLNSIATWSVGRGVILRLTNRQKAPD